MTVRQFVKSQAFKCIVVLLAIALVAGGLLAILNDLLAVSAEERTMRAIESVYGESLAYESLDFEESELSNEYGTIDQVYLLENGAYMVRSTGGNGYKNGTVTMWVVLDPTDAGYDIYKVVLEEYSKQTLMSQFGNSFYTVYTAHNDELADGNVWFSVEADGIQNTQAGATMSSRAINNSVNCALYFARNVLSSTLTGGEQA